MNTMVTPRTKFIVRACPNSAAEARPVKIVATVEEYFFKIVSAKDPAKVPYERLENNKNRFGVKALCQLAKSLALFRRMKQVLCQPFKVFIKPLEMNGKILLTRYFLDI